MYTKQVHILQIIQIMFILLFSFYTQIIMKGSVALQYVNVYVSYCLLLLLVYFGFFLNVNKMFYNISAYALSQKIFP